MSASQMRQTIYDVMVVFNILWFKVCMYVLEIMEGITTHCGQHKSFMNVIWGVHLKFSIISKQHSMKGVSDIFQQVSVFDMYNHKISSHTYVRLALMFIQGRQRSLKSTVYHSSPFQMTISLFFLSSFLAYLDAKVGFLSESAVCCLCWKQCS